MEFHSAHRPTRGCAYRQSTVVRSGEVLSRLGKMAEVLMTTARCNCKASGRITPDTAPALYLVGRLQWHAEAGRWTEWYALLDDGSTRPP